jgi:hypothetical protein
MHLIVESSIYKTISLKFKIPNLAENEDVFIFCGLVKGFVIEYAYPPGFNIKVNKAFVNLSMLKADPPVIAPFNITDLCKIDANYMNVLELTYTSPREYVLEVRVLKRKSISSLINGMKSSSFKSLQDMLLFYKRKSEEFDVEDLGGHFSVLCPLSSTRILDPGKSMRCSHYQSFDLTNYILANFAQPKWRCPVCNESAPLQALFYDGLVERVLLDPKLLEYTDFSVDSNGHIEPVKTKVVETVKEETVEVIDLTNVDENDLERYAHVYFKKESSEFEIEQPDIEMKPNKKRKTDIEVLEFSSTPSSSSLFMVEKIEAPGETRYSAIVLE